MKGIVFAAFLLWAVAGCGQSSIKAGGAAVTNPNIAAFPAPPSTATFFNNLQAQASSAWTVQGGSSCCAGSTTGATAITFGNSVPSLTDSSIYVGATGNGYNVQAFTPQSCASFPGGVCSGIGHLQADIYIKVATTLQGVECPDTTIYTGTYQIYPSVQCAVNGGSTTPTVPTWNLWGEAAGWVSTNQSCNAYQTNTSGFQHVQWLVLTNFTASPPTITYSKLYVQNQPVSLASMVGGTTTFNATSYSSSSGAIKPQCQVDSLSTSTAAGFYIDSYNVAAW